MLDMSDDWCLMRYNGVRPVMWSNSYYISHSCNYENGETPGAPWVIVARGPMVEMERFKKLAIGVDDDKES